VAGFENKFGKGQGQYTQQSNTAKASELIDFIETRPLKTPKVSQKIKNELKKKVPTYMQKSLDD